MTEDDRIGPAGSGWATWQEVLEPALVLLAAQAVGGARYALEITTQYAKDRHQFDKPLGAFQALAHYLADAVTNLDGAEQLVHEAAWAGATGRSLESLAPMAKLFACSTFRDITAMAQQLFGGIGFTLDFDIQLYFRRAKQQQLMWANDRALEDAVAGDALRLSSGAPFRAEGRELATSGALFSEAWNPFTAGDESGIWTGSCRAPETSLACRSRDRGGAAC